MRSFFKMAAYVIACIVVLMLLLTGIATALFYIYKLPPSHSARAKLFSHQVFCHRANVYEAPEDTLAAVKQAKKEGCTGVEIDVFLTKDRQLVVFHDETLDRLTSQHGYIWDYTYDQLKALKIIFKGKPSTEGIPRLSDLLALAKSLHLKVELDLKLTGNAKKYAAQIAALYQSMDLYDSVLASSFYPTLLYQLRSVDAHIVTSLAIFERPFPQHLWLSAVLYQSEMTWLPHFLGVGLMEPHLSLVSLGFIQYWLKQGIYTNVFTVNASADKTWLSYHQVTYQTDCMIGACAERDYKPWVPN